MSHPTLAVLVDIALEAGAAILPIFNARDDEQGVRQKDDGSPVTLADEAAEAVILDRLAAAGVPRAIVVAEEAVSGGAVPDTSGDFYLVDPLDGTKEFVSGSGEFTVNIARVEGGVPVAGVVYAPAKGTLYAADGGGAWKADVIDHRLSGREPISTAAPGAALRVVASKSHLTQETKDFIDRYCVDSFISSGSSLKFCRVAEGSADLYPRMGRTMEWDTGAGHAVLLAAGGKVLNTDGKPLVYGKTEGDTFANPHFVAAGAFDPFSTTHSAS